MKTSTAEKRVHSEAFQEAGHARDEAGTPKRTKNADQTPSSEAVALLRGHAKELIHCLTSLSNGDASDTETVPEGLTLLSRTLLPAFSALGAHDAKTSVPAPAGGAGVVPASVHTPTPAKPETIGGGDVPPANAPQPTSAASRFANRIPALGTLTAWTPADIPDTYPPLPPIPNPAIEQIALTHHGMRRNTWEASYENLEFLGDAFVYHVVSEYLSQTFPQLSPGRLSQLRERLVCNANLAQYTRHYGIDKRAKLPDEFQGEGRLATKGTKATDKERLKVHGDLFEAYVGGLIRSHETAEAGVAVATRWLKPLWALTLAKDIRGEYRKRAEAVQRGALLTPGDAVGRGSGSVSSNGGNNGTVPTNSDTQPSNQVSAVTRSPKVQLAHLIGCRGVVIRYEEVPGKGKRDQHNNLPLFTVGVWVDAWGKSECLATSSALSKKDAGSKAAEKALENKKLMKAYMSKKQAFLEAQKAQAAL
ncbi:nucleolar rnase [Niveomyces insectorum RCEF 264]|uniref:Nucleolar rnase n=1 Tax=Niveomyces insectorum RCEF 264 TaxID=1081102 RepID=A0A167X1H5_9HYPO|nr:nucleolar rnase [Niveomyces insectorum RCEF 264]